MGDLEQPIGATAAIGFVKNEFEFSEEEDRELGFFIVQKAKEMWNRRGHQHHHPDEDHGGDKPPVDDGGGDPVIKWQSGATRRRRKPPISADRLPHAREDNTPLHPNLEPEWEKD